MVAQKKRMDSLVGPPPVGRTEVRRQFAALPYVVDDDGQISVLLITSRGSGRWVLPKGWPIGAESGAEAAGREAFEEAGVVGCIPPQAMLGHYRYMKLQKDGAEVRCQVFVYAMEVTSSKADFPERGRRVLRWCAPEHAARLVHEPELAKILQKLGRTVSPPLNGAERASGKRSQREDA